MLKDPKHGPLPLPLLLLTALAGVVDAVSYLGLGHVFVANMTGNVVFLGFAAGGAPGVSAAGSAIALAAFFAGSLGGGRIALALGQHRGRLLGIACLLSAVVILGAAGVAFVGGGEALSPRFALIALLAAAMGLQSATARHVGVPDLNTTVVTMTLVALASETHLAGRMPVRLGVRLAAIGAMFAGAFAGAAVITHGGLAATLILAGVLAVVTAAGILRVSRPRVSWALPS